MACGSETTQPTREWDGMREWDDTTDTRVGWRDRRGDGESVKTVTTTVQYSPITPRLRATPEQTRKTT